MKKIHPASEIPLPFSSEEFKGLWADWLDHRKELKKPVTQLAAKHQLKFLLELGESAAMQSIHTSIRNGWQGIFPVAKSITNCKTVHFEQGGGF
jgi:hypothetical protein